jgi:MOSC domain-containing protein YiiM
VSLLPLEEIEGMKRWIPGLKPGDFAENIITSGVNFDLVEVGDRIDIQRSVSLEITQIGKECHSGCEIQRVVGRCIMPEKGIFARVLKGGFIQKNDPIRIKKAKGKSSHQERVLRGKPKKFTAKDYYFYRFNLLGR